MPEASAAATFTSAGAADIFVVKLWPDGSHVWSKSYGDSNTQSGAAIVVDAAGDVLVTGSFSGAVDLGGNTPATSAGPADIFVVKLGPDGSHLWSKAYGTGSGAGIATYGGKRVCHRVVLRCRELRRGASLPKQRGGWTASWR